MTPRLLTAAEVAAIAARANPADGPKSVMDSVSWRIIGTDVPALLADRAALVEELARVHEARDAAEADGNRQRVLQLRVELNEANKKLAEVERERDMMRRPSNAAARQLFTERDAAIAERDRLAGEVERMRPVVEAGCELADVWQDGDEGIRARRNRGAILVQRVTAYRAAPQTPAAEPGHGVGCRSINSGCGGDCDCKPAPSSAGEGSGT